MTDLTARKTGLQDRLTELDQRMRGIGAELLSHQAKDWQDLAVEREADEVLEGMGASGRLEMRQIEAALLRIEAGTYGLCARCGLAVGEDRLEALPDTPFCRDCAEAVA